MRDAEDVYEACSKRHECHQNTLALLDSQHRVRGCVPSPGSRHQHPACSFPWRRAICTLPWPPLAAWASCPVPHPPPGLGRLGRLSGHFLHSAGALIENLGGLAYLFSWNAAGYIFMAFSQQCGVSVSNYNSEKQSQSPSKQTQI